jgi:hypothetical protein
VDESSYEPRRAQLKVFEIVSGERIEKGSCRIIGLCKLRPAFEARRSIRPRLIINIARAQSIGGAREFSGAKGSAGVKRRPSNIAGVDRQIVEFEDTLEIEAVAIAPRREG